MNHIKTLPFAILCLCLTACGASLKDPASIDSPEEVLEATVMAAEYTAEVLSGVQTLEDAKAAAIEIEAVSENLKAIDERLKALGKELPKPSEEMLKQMEAKAESLKPRAEAASKTIQDEVKRIYKDKDMKNALFDAVWRLNFN